MTYDILNGEAIELPLAFEKLPLKRKTLLSTLRFQGSVPPQDIEDMIDNTLGHIREICKPRFGFRIVTGNIPDKTHILAENIMFNPAEDIVNGLEYSSRFVLMTGSVGHEMSEWLESDGLRADIMLGFIADSWGSVIAESTVEWGMKEVSSLLAEKGLKVTNSYCPGHCGWHISEQHKFFSLLPENFCGISICESGLMLPIKSVSALAGIGEKVEKRPYGCAICQKEDCYKNRLYKQNNHKK